MKMLRNDFSCGLKVAPTSTNFYVTGRSGERNSMSQRVKQSIFQSFF